MSNALIQISGLSQDAMEIFILVFARVGGAVALIPIFGEQAVPVRVRLVLAIVMTGIVFPAAAPYFIPALPVGPLFFFSIVTQALTGLAIGFMLRLFVFALQIAASIAAQSISLSQLFGGATTEPMPAYGQFLVSAALALAVSLGMHVQFARLLISTYAFASPAAGSMLDFTAWGVAGISRSMRLAFSLAAPFVIVSLIYNLALGVINKAMPQLMVTLIGAPAIAFGGLVLLAVFAPFILQAWIAAMSYFIISPLG